MRVDGVEVVLGDVGEPSGDPLVDLVECPERARDDDQPAPRSQSRRECPQDPGRGEVVGLSDGINLISRVSRRAHP